MATPYFTNLSAVNTAMAQLTEERIALQDAINANPELKNAYEILFNEYTDIFGMLHRVKDEGLTFAQIEPDYPYWQEQRDLINSLKATITRLKPAAAPMITVPVLSEDAIPTGPVLGADGKVYSSITDLNASGQIAWSTGENGTTAEYEAAKAADEQRKQIEAAENAAQVIADSAIIVPEIFPRDRSGIVDPGFSLFPEKDEQPIMDFTFSNIPVTFSQLYVSTFGRAPDVEGFNYWKGVIGGDLDLKEYDDFVYAGRLNGEKVNEQNVANIRSMIRQVTPLISAPIETPVTGQAAGGNTGLLIAAALAALTLLG